MARDRLFLTILLIVQVVAVVIYPPAFFQRSPQSIVLPPALLLLLALALIGMNTGVLTPMAGRVSLVFVQGINVVVRMIMLFPNLRIAGRWNWPFIIINLLGIALSWWAIIEMERRPVHTLMIRQKSQE